MKDLETIREACGPQLLVEVLAEDAHQLQLKAEILAKWIEKGGNISRLNGKNLTQLHQVLAMIHRDELLIGKIFELQHKADEQLMISYSVHQWAEKIRAEQAKEADNEAKKESAPQQTASRQSGLP